MRKYDIDLYKKKLQKKLDSDRYEHTIGVAYTAASLAMRYKYDVNKALIAGLLHDNAKCISYEKKIQLCEKYNIHLSEVEKENPALLHAKLGAFLAMHKFNITDKDIISSILYHTTGRPDMSILDKIIYVADYIEPMRYKARNLEEIREMAFIDLDKALLKILEDTLEYLKSINGKIDPLTQKTYKFYKNLQDNNETECKE